MRTLVVDKPKPGEKPTESELNIESEELLQRAMIVLQREIRNLMIASSEKKLEPAHAKDLMEYVKLLSDIESKKVNQLAQLTDEELEEIAAKEKKAKRKEKRQQKAKEKTNANQPEGG